MQTIDESQVRPAWMSPYATFVAEHFGRSKEEFLAEVCDPYLVLSGLQGVGTDSTDFVTLRALPLESLAALNGSGNLAIGPVKKRPGSNPFQKMITLGRADNNDLVVRHGMVSKFHVYFRDLGDGWTITDANSSNGTAVDGRELPARESVALRSGTWIVLGESVQLEFVQPIDLYARMHAAPTPPGGMSRRRHPRFETDLPARFSNLADPGGDALLARIRNMGPEGAFLRTNTLAPLHSEIALSFHVPTGVGEKTEEVRTTARVLWRRSKQGKTGMGCQFLDLSDEAKHLLCSYMARHRAKFSADVPTE